MSATPVSARATDAATDRSALRLHIDWPACDGRGLCTELLPELLTEDPWGYPAPVSIRGRDPLPPNGIPVPAELEAHARDAVAACPLMALRLERG